jgi:hypothetical protein
MLDQWLDQLRNCQCLAEEDLRTLCEMVIFSAVSQSGFVFPSFKKCNANR